MAVIPPWLDTRPSDFAQAAEAGQQFGITRERMAIEAQQSAAQLALARRQFQTETAQKQMQIQMSKEEADRNYQLQLQKHAFDTKIQQTQLDLDTATAARKFQAQQKYQQLVAQGVDPAQAMMQIGPDLGVNMVGLAGLAKESRPIAPPASFDFGDAGKGVVYNGQYHPAKLPKSDEEQMSERDTARLKVLTAREKVLMASAKDQLTGEIQPSPELTKVQQEIDQLTTEEGGGEASGDEGGDIGDDGQTPTRAPAISRYKIIVAPQ